MSLSVAEALPRFTSNYVTHIDADFSDLEVPKERTQLELIANQMVSSYLEKYHNPDQFDPIEGLKTFKYYLIGKLVQIARYNQRLAPPGAVEETDGFHKEYVVECAAMIDESTADVCIVRKDHDVDPCKSDAWYVATYNLLDGSFNKRNVVAAQVTKEENGGDEIELELSANSMYQSGDKLSLKVDKMYHNVGPVTSTRPKYYGRGVGEQPEQYEQKFNVDISRLETTINQAFLEHDIPNNVLDSLHLPTISQLGRRSLQSI